MNILSALNPKKAITVIAIMAAILVTACKSEPPAPPVTQCELTGTFERAEGFNTFYGEYFIRVEDGSLIYPCVVEGNTINQRDVYDGMPITLTYKLISTEEGACQVNSSILPGGCVVPPQARITCISEQVVRCGTGGWCGTR
ncbi:MAG: hypothetical protein F9K23_17140 [Bacteroidetes bacterium]|nr:MAG: hypothetical protein F9K23_17140 [Bacteroidota bacterium]